MGDETITVDGLTFRVRVEPDNDSDPPWKSDCGHGEVTDWTARCKNSGERIIAQDRGHYRYYDYAGAMAIAKRDAWGISEADRIKLAETLGHAPTTGQIFAAAVDADYERMRAWCADEWSYVGVCVQLLDTDGAPVDGFQDALWGIESDAGDYLQEVAKDCAANIIAEHKISKRTRILQRVIQIRPYPTT